MKKTNMVILWFLFQTKRVLNMKHEQLDNKQLEFEAHAEGHVTAPLWCVLTFCIFNKKAVI